MKRENPQPEFSGGNAKRLKEEDEVEVEEMDDLFAVLGYKVKTSEMADVALKLEQLEDMMAKSSTQADDGASFFDGAHHCNPSDLSSWLESMLSEFSFAEPNQKSTPDYDLKVIPGDAVFASSQIRKQADLPSSSAIASRPVILVNYQENGIRLIHLLLACADAVQASNLSVAEALLEEIRILAASQAGAMRKVASYFADALAMRIYRCPPLPAPAVADSTLLSHFYEACPYIKFAHFTANQAILEAFEGKRRVHVIDFSINDGLQWPALMQALALRPGGPPSFRLTGLRPPSPDRVDHLQAIGWKLAQFAEAINVEFQYKGFVANSLADLDSVILDLRPGETVAVNSIFDLHKLLASPGSLEKVLTLVKKINPEIFTMVEQEANHNGLDFVTRFTEALHYYSALFDSIDGSELVQSEEDRVMSELHLGRQILNIVGCEGPQRVERHEKLLAWRNRISKAGFDPVSLGSNAFKQASMLISLFGGGDGYGVEESDGCLFLGWHTRPLIGTSAWRLQQRCPPLTPPADIHTF